MSSSKSVSLCPSSIFLLLLHTLEFLQLQLAGCKSQNSHCHFTPSVQGIFCTYSPIFGEREGELCLRRKIVKSLKKNVPFSFLYLPFLPDDLALRYETGQSEVNINIVMREG